MPTDAQPRARKRREWTYRPVIRFALTLFRVLGFRFTLRGQENIPLAGGAVLASNHISYFDFMIIGLLPHKRGKRLVRFMAKKSVFDNKIAGPLMRGMHHIPVDRAAGAAAYRHAVSALASGELVGVFPEQTISRSFEPREFKMGAARMALEAGVPLLPVAVWGPQRVWTANRKPTWTRRVPVTLFVGEPLPVDAATTAESLTEQLHAAVTALVHEAQTTYPDDGTGQWWQPTALGGAALSPEQAREADLAAIAGKQAARAAKAAKAAK